MDFEQEKELKEIQHKMDCYRQIIQATIDCAAKALNGLFLLNGAAATALLAQKGNVPLQATGIIFAFGALLAIAGLGTSHVLNIVISETWRMPEPPDRDTPWIPSLPLKLELSRNQLSAWRLKNFVFCCSPAVVFLIGLIAAGLSL